MTAWGRCEWYYDWYIMRLHSIVWSCDPASPSHWLASYNFITEPEEDLNCSICLKVARRYPWQHEECGKLFCRKCIEQYGIDKPCPSCEKEKPRYFEDKRSKYNLLGSLTVIRWHLVNYVGRTRKLAAAPPQFGSGLSIPVTSCIPVALSLVRVPL